MRKLLSKVDNYNTGHSASDEKDVVILLRPLLVHMWTTDSETKRGWPIDRPSVITEPDLDNRLLG